MEIEYIILGLLVLILLLVITQKENFQIGRKRTPVKVTPPKLGKPTNQRRFRI